MAFENYEEIRLNIVDQTKGAVDSANKGLESVERKAEQAAKAVDSAVNSTATKLVGITTKSANSIERIVAAVERRTAQLNKSPIDRLNAERELSINRVKSSEEAVNRVNAAYGRLIQSQRESLRIEESSRRQGVVAQVEQRAALAGRSALGRLELERQGTLRNVAGDPEAINRVNAAYGRLIQVQREHDAQLAQSNSLVRQFSAQYGAAIASIAASYFGLGQTLNGIIALVRTAQDLQELQLSLTALFRSGVEGKQVFEELVGLAIRFPRAFNLEKLSEYSKLLAAFKFNAQQIPAILQSLAGAAILGEDRVRRLIIATGQIKSKGVLQAEEALQLAEAGVEVYGTLAKAAGRSEQDIRKLGERAILRSDAVLPLILADIERTFGGVNQAIDQQTRTIAARVQTQLLLAGSRVGGLLDDIFRGALNASLVPVADLLDRTTQKLSEMGTALGISADNARRLAEGLGAIFAENIAGPGSPIGALLATAKAVSDAVSRNDRQRQQNAFLGALKRGKSSGDLAGIGVTREEAVRLFGEVEGRNIATQNSLLSQVDIPFREAQGRFRQSIVEEERKKAAEDAKKKAAGARERITTELDRLRESTAGAEATFLFGDSDVGRAQQRILESRRNLTKFGASDATKQEAEALIRLELLYTNLNQAERKRRQDQEQQAKKTAQQIQEEAELLYKVQEAERAAANERDRRLSALFEQNQSSILDSRARQIASQRDQALAALGVSPARTVEEKIAVEEQKLQIEIQYRRRSEELELEKLKREQQAQIAFFSSALAFADAAQVARINQQIELVNSIYSDQIARRTQDLADTEKVLRGQAAGQIAQVQIEQQDRVFQHWRTEYSRTIDALLSTTRSWGDKMRAILDAAILTPIKDALSTLLASTTTGQSPRGRFAGGQASGGLGGVLGRLLGGGGGVFGGSPVFGSASSPGGTGTFTGAPINLPAGAGGASRRFPLGALLGFGGTGGFLFNSGSIALGGGAATTAAGIGGLKGTLAGIGSSGAALLGGAGLAAFGVQRGGLLGSLLGVGGGALAGFALGAKIGSIGGPIGALIGAGIGGGAALIRSLFSTADDKVRREVQNVYGVEVREKSIRQQILGIARSSFGGNIPLAVRTPQVGELISLYRASTGLGGSGFSSGPVPFTLANRGGSLFQVPSIQAGGSFVNSTLIPSTTPAQVPVVLQLDGATTERVLQGQAVRVIQNQPGLVSESAAQGLRSSFGANAFRASVLEPLTVG